MITYGSLVVYITPKGRRYIKKLEADKDWHNNDGTLLARDVADANFGDVVFTNLNVPIRIQEATLEDRLMGIKRQTQIIYPKDIAYICLRLGAGPNRIIAEAGCGSGSLTIALSWFCGPTGKVIAQDFREEFVRLAVRNLAWANAAANVELHCKDVEQGFVATNADALFLDVREPWLYLEQAQKAVKHGAVIGFLLPTVNQASELLAALEKGPFAEIDMCEILIRRWKTIPDRLRPQDRMVAHTSFLIFCRKSQKSEAFNNALPHGTRERKQELAKRLREASGVNDISDNKSDFE